VEKRRVGFCERARFVEMARELVYEVRVAKRVKGLHDGRGRVYDSQEEMFACLPTIAREDGKFRQVFMPSCCMGRISVAGAVGALNASYGQAFAAPDH
jgi:hypothetical protein